MIISREVAFVGREVQNESGTVALPCMLTSLKVLIDWCLDCVCKSFFLQKLSATCTFNFNPQSFLSVRCRWKVLPQDFSMYFVHVDPGLLGFMVCLGILLSSSSQACATWAEGIFPSNELPRWRPRPARPSQKQSKLQLDFCRVGCSACLGLCLKNPGNLTC